MEKKKRGQRGKKIEINEEYSIRFKKKKKLFVPGIFNSNNIFTIMINQSVIMTKIIWKFDIIFLENLIYGKLQYEESSPFIKTLIDSNNSKVSVLLSFFALYFKSNQK